MKDENYYVVQGWMINRLGLRGNELMAYALIYGFSQDGQTWFTGSAKYLASWLGVDRRNALAVLQRLVSKGLLIKNERVINGVKFCDYMACDKYTGGDKTSLGGGDESSLGGGDETSQGLINNIPQKEIKKKNTPFEEFWVNYKPVAVDGKTTGRGNKHIAEKKYNQIIQSGVSAEELLRAAKLYLEDCRRNGRYSQMVSTWLNQHGWENDYEEDQSMDWDEVVRCWNIVAERWGLAKIAGLTEERKRRFVSAFAESGKGSIVELFKGLDMAIMGSFLLQGKKQVKVGDEWETVCSDWVCDFDFFMRGGNCLKAIECGYDDPDTLKHKSAGRWQRIVEMQEAKKTVHWD